MQQHITRNIKISPTPVRLVASQPWKPHAHTLIAFDFREPFPSILQTDGFDKDLKNDKILYVETTLSNGDICISQIQEDGICLNKVIMERKTCTDLIDTLVDPDRFINIKTFKQCAHLDGSKPVLIIEKFHKMIKGVIVESDGNLKFSASSFRRDVSSASVFGVLNTFAQNMPVMFTVSDKHTLRCIINLAKNITPTLLKQEVAFRLPTQFITNKARSDVFVHENSPQVPANDVIFIPYAITKKKKKSNNIIHERLIHHKSFNLWKWQEVSTYARETTNEVSLIKYTPPVPVDLLDPVLLQNTVITYKEDQVFTIQGSFKKIGRNILLKDLISFFDALQNESEDLSQLKYHGLYIKEKKIIYIFPIKNLNKKYNEDTSMYTSLSKFVKPLYDEHDKIVLIGCAMCHVALYYGINIESCDDAIPVKFMSENMHIILQAVLHGIDEELIQFTLFETIPFDQLVDQFSSIKSHFID